MERVEGVDESTGSLVWGAGVEGEGRTGVGRLGHGRISRMIRFCELSRVL